MAELVKQSTKLSRVISKASTAWRFLHGTINVYKPAEMSVPVMINAIKTNICKGK